MVLISLGSRAFWFQDIQPWAAPVGSLVAALVAARALAHNRWIRDREMVRDRMAQASLVSSWVEREQVVIKGLVSIRPTVVRVRNASSAVIYETRVGLRAGEIIWGGDFGIIPPNETQKVTVPVEVVTEMNLYGADPSPAELQLIFRDASNVYWKRDVTGRLSEIDQKSVRTLSWTEVSRTAPPEDRS